MVFGFSFLVKKDSHSWALGPLLSYEKFMMGILLTPNLELFTAE
jgi:hypothetical protein